MPSRRIARLAAALGSILFVAGLFANRPGLDPHAVSVAQGLAIVVGGAVGLTGFVMLGRLGEGARWRAPAVAVGSGMVLLAAASDSLGLGTGGGIGPKQVVLAAAGLLIAGFALPAKRRLLTLIPIPLLAVVVAGLGVRAWFMASYRPGFFGYYDAIGYISAANLELFGTPYRPAGEPLVVRLLRHVSEDLSVTVAAHHLFGVVTAVVLYLALRRAGSGPWLAAFPAGVVLLGGSQIFLEHSVMSEPAFTLLLAGAVYCAFRAREGAHWKWAASAGMLIGLATTIRAVGLVVLGAFVVWWLIEPGPARRRLTGVAVASVSCLLLVGLYVGAHAQVTGHWGLTRTQGMTLYARVAGFADCSKFDPPTGLESLCPDGNPSERPPAVDYMYDVELSPALQEFGPPPALEQSGAKDRSDFEWGHDDELGTFARSAILGQPLDYAESVALAMANLVVRVGPPHVRDWDSDRMVLQMRSQEDEDFAATIFPASYDTPPAYLRRNAGALDAYGRHVRVEGPLSAALLAVFLVGAVLGRGPKRRAAALFFLVAFSLQLATAATLYYDVRYSTPSFGFLAAAAALAGAALVERRQSSTVGRPSSH